MKTIISLIIAIAAMFAVASCGGGSNNTIPPEHKYNHDDYFNPISQSDEDKIITDNSTKYITGTAGLSSDIITAYSSGIWCKGDFHNHSNVSDGKQSPASNIKKAEDIGFDYFAVSDHNGAAWYNNPEYISSKLTLMYASEITSHDYTTGNPYGATEGHMLVLSTTPFDYTIIANLIGGIIDYYNTAHGLASDILIGAAHVDSWWHWEKLETTNNTDIISIWNGIEDETNIDFRIFLNKFSFFDKSSHKTYIGESDAHDLAIHPLDWPTTMVFAPSKNATDIMNGIRSRCVVITNGVNGPAIQMLAGTAKIGEVISNLNVANTITVSVNNCKTDEFIVILKNDTVLAFSKCENTVQSISISDIPVAGDIYYTVTMKMSDDFESYDIDDVMKAAHITSFTNFIYTN